jgi:hypothetical protein
MGGNQNIAMSRRMEQFAKLGLLPSKCGDNEPLLMQ